MIRLAIHTVTGNTGKRNRQQKSTKFIMPNQDNSTNSYKSVPGQCGFCGETNHVTATWKHHKVRCFTRNNRGHKSKHHVRSGVQEDGQYEVAIALSSCDLQYIPTVISRCQRSSIGGAQGVNFGNLFLLLAGTNGTCHAY